MNKIEYLKKLQKIQNAEHILMMTEGRFGKHENLINLRKQKNDLITEFFKDKPEGYKINS